MYANRVRVHPLTRVVRVRRGAVTNGAGQHPKGNKDRLDCLERTLSSSTVYDCHSSSKPWCRPCALTNSPTLICRKGIGDSSTRSWAWVDFPVPGVPVMMITGERLVIISKSKDECMWLRNEHDLVQRQAIICPFDENFHLWPGMAPIARCTCSTLCLTSRR